jgi:hypothetical protein
MQIELPYFGGCLNWLPDGARIRDSLHTVGAAATLVTCRTAGSADEAGRLGFRGSPTILVDGRDHFARPAGQAGLACRAYPTANGAHSRIVGQIQTVLADAA